jgi:hypothetical protein
VTRAQRRVASDAFVTIGGGALIVSAFVHWISEGDGSGLRGHALIDAIVAIGRHFPGLSAARLTVLWYLVPASGAASWIATGLRGAGSRWARVAAAVAVCSAVLATIAFGWMVGFSHLGAGAWLALAGAAALVVSTWLIAPGRTGADPSVRMADRGR